MQEGDNEHLAKLADNLTDEDFRNSFASDHARALSNADIDAGQLPSGVLEALKGCSAAELRALVDVRDALEANQVDRRYWVQIV
jgi:hypothetical protein